MPIARVRRAQTSTSATRASQTATVRRMINDRRDDMTLAELVEELELSHPEKVASFERRYPEAMAAIAEDDLDACDPEELDDLAGDLRRLLRV